MGMIWGYFQNEKEVKTRLKEEMSLFFFAVAELAGGRDENRINGIDFDEQLMELERSKDDYEERIKLLIKDNSKVKNKLEMYAKMMNTDWKYI